MVNVEVVIWIIRLNKILLNFLVPTLIFLTHSVRRDPPAGLVLLLTSCSALDDIVEMRKWRLRWVGGTYPSGSGPGAATLCTAPSAVKHGYEWKPVLGMHVWSFPLSLHIQK